MLDEERYGLYVSGENWPALEDGFRMKWSGYITLPDTRGLVLELEVDGQPKANSEILLDNAPMPDVLPRHCLEEARGSSQGQI